MDHPTVVRYI